MKTERFFTRPLGIVIAATITMFLWGSAFPMIKKSYTELAIAPNEIFEQMLFAGYRFVLAGLLIMGVMAVTGKGFRYERGSLPGLARVALFQTFFQYVLFYIGLSYSGGMQGAIIAGTTSFFQIILAHFMYKNDSLDWRKTLGMVLGFLGVILANATKGPLQLSLGLGEMLLLGAMFCGGLGNILARNETARMDILYMTSSQMILGGLGLTLVGASKVGFFPFTFSPSALWMLLYLAFLSAAGFVLWNNVMKYNKVGNVSMYMFLIPVFGVFLSAVILHETLHASVLAALLLVVIGIVIVNRQKKVQPQSDQR
ncbi:MAG TPA: DMT family transporter [Candidatus Bathyarchaeia archaeon]|nr:DMT family transporter [Candidatus Bathyarchaeia archaeon]